MTVRGVGVDLVQISAFAEQLDRPGTRFATVFTAGEQRDCREASSDAARHFAARWAAKEAVIKAWSDSLHGEPPLLGEQIYEKIEVVKDAWGRPR
ncbi:MAG: holo-ACP synthase, partial [Nocardioidaceae bacterium]|nr:holo-ACP synthase [Nocardioidaceae bacterium]